MVDVIGRAKVIITGDVDSASIDQSGRKIGSSLRAGATVGVAALGTLTVAGVKAFKAFEEAEAQSRKLNTVLTNMGEGNAAPAVEKLADELMRLTAIDDEVIKGGQTILATFDSVNDSAGQVGGTFDRATRAAVDMSTIFGSVESASRAVGKALEDPEKAVSLLRGANVFLNEEQQKLIENFLEAGEKAKAQDVILDALEDRYAGTAEAAKTTSGDISQAFDELEESAGELIAALAGDEKGKGGGLSGAIYGVSDALSSTAKSKAWDDFGKDVRDTGSKIGDLTTGLFNLDKRIGATILKLPGLGEGFRDLIDPTHGLIGVVLDLVDAFGDLKDLMEGDWQGNGGLVLNDNGRGDWQDVWPGRASGGPTRGLTLVGENGPELAAFGSSGGYVFNNSQTREMLSKASGGTTVTNYNLYGPNSLSQARREEDWSRKYGTRFGSAASAAAL